jgi:hypothetical protein
MPDDSLFTVLARYAAGSRLALGDVTGLAPLCGWLGAAPLSLTVESNERLEGTTGCQLTGTMQLFGIDVSGVILRATTIDGEPLLTLDASLPNTWTLHTGLGGLPSSMRWSGDGIGYIQDTSLFATLPLTDQRVVVSDRRAIIVDVAEASTELEAGINFSARLPSGAVPAALRTFIALPDSILLRGTIALPAADALPGALPVLNLRADVSGVQHSLLHAKLDRYAIIFRTTPDSGFYYPRSESGIEAMLTVGEALPSLRVAATVLEADRFWNLSFTPDPDAPLTLAGGMATLPALLGFDPGLPVPDFFGLASKLYLTGVWLTIDTELATVRSIDAEIGAAASINAAWSLPASIRVEQLALRIFAPTVGATGTAGAQARAVLRLGSSPGVSVKLETEVRDYTTFTGELLDSVPVDLASIVEPIVSIPALPSVEVSKFMVSLSSSGDFTILCALTENWTVPFTGNQLQLEETWFRLQRAGGVMSGSFVALFSIAGCELQLDGASVEGGWLFNGASRDGRALAMGALFDELSARLGGIHLPAAIADLTIDQLAVSLDTRDGSAAFTCNCLFPAGGPDARATIEIKRTAGPPSTYRLKGELSIAGRIFDLVLDTGGTSTVLIARYASASGGDAIALRDLAAALSSALGDLIPAEIAVTVSDGLVMIDRGPPMAFALAITLSARLELSKIPLVGGSLPADQALGAENLRLLAASAAFSRDAVERINAELPADARLPLASKAADDDPAASRPAISRGASISGLLRLGTETEPISLALGGAAQSLATADAPPAAPALWLKIQRGFGPLHVEQIGLRYQRGAIAILFDASLAAGPLTLELDGLSLGSSLAEFSPSFDLLGLGLAYTGGPVSISGAFVHDQTKDADGKAVDEYAGRAVLRGEQLSVAALGAYAPYQGHPSLFVYGFLDRAFGGPPFFFVTGLAAGFGYNRALHPPPIDGVEGFPLVLEARGIASQKPLTEELAALHDYVVPSVGDAFLTAGVAFNSFKLVDSFALLTVSLGSRTEVAVLGYSTAIVPPASSGSKTTALAELHLALDATYRPDEGELQVQGRLTDASYILSKACHLTGGFAFCAWLSGRHAGDFVQTIGGYHPAFQPLDHYPAVPRLQFNWIVDEHLTLKGTAYYALTPSTLMAGGQLEAVWSSGAIRAWFKADADFLIAWQPYHYDARISVDMGVSYTFHFLGTHEISVDVGADLHVWGPEFSGLARIHLWIVSFEVSFGDASPAKRTEIGWDAFMASFLPGADQICGASATGGLERAIAEGQDSRWIVNPAELRISTATAIPATRIGLGAGARTVESTPAAVEVVPMAMASPDLVSEHVVCITRDGGPSEDAFDFCPAYSAVPSALWGKAGGQGALLSGALTGMVITPRPGRPPDVTRPLARAGLQYSTHLLPDAFAWERISPAAITQLTDADRRDRVRAVLASSDTLAARRALVAALGFDANTFDLEGGDADDYLVAPQLCSTP